MDVLHWDGTLSTQDFRIGTSSFTQKWESLNFGFLPWSLILSPKHSWLASPEEGYSSQEKICISRPNEEDIQTSQIDNGEEETGCSGNEDIIDDATLVQSSHHDS